MDFETAAIMSNVARLLADHRVLRTNKTLQRLCIELTRDGAQIEREPEPDAESVACLQH